MLGLLIHNTLSGKKEEFIPLEEGKVRMYVCGLTVQERPHIGHMRAAMVADLVQRWFEYKGFEVTQIQNITDVDDKVIERAKEEKRDYRQIAEENEREYREVCTDLGISGVKYYPRASQHMEQIITLIERLFKKGFAYQIDGNVYYEVSKFRDYGKLSKKKIEHLRAGARVEVDERKRSPLDFALWKSAKEGEPWWESPWGRGRPGWHIECSAMSMHYLGDTFDIHTGGTDLIFPHHENEIAQSEGATGKPFARYWLHNEWVMLTGEKMSKSTGHFVPIKDVLQRFAPDVVRFYLLSTHYRSQIDFEEERLEGARSALSRLTNVIDSLARGMGGGGEVAPLSPGSLSGREREFYRLVSSKCGEFESAMDDDFNTPKALGALFDVVKTANVELPGLESRELLSWTVERMTSLARILGLFRKRIVSLRGSVEAEAQVSGSLTVLRGPERDDLMKLIVELREELRREKDWERADKLRRKLKELGVDLEDRPDGTIWKYR